MGKVVLNILKEKEVGAHITAHIVRQTSVTLEDGTIETQRFVPPSVRDETRMVLNRVLIGGDTPRADLVNNRIRECGIKKVRADQVRSHLVVMTGTHEDMSALEDEGRLDDWIKDAIDLAQRMYGKENVVQAVLHMDEKTPHIHFTCVPLLQGETKYKKKAAESAKIGGRKAKSATEWRLCSKEVFCPQNARMWQTWAGETMRKYGLERGVIADTPTKSLTTTEWVEQEVEWINSMKPEAQLAEKKRDLAYQQRDDARIEHDQLFADNIKLKNENNQLKDDIERLTAKKANLIAETDKDRILQECNELADMLANGAERMPEHSSWIKELKSSFQEWSNRTIALLFAGKTSVVSGIFKHNNEEIALTNVELKTEKLTLQARDSEDSVFIRLSSFLKKKIDARKEKQSQTKKNDPKKIEWGNWGKKKGMGI